MCYVNGTPWSLQCRACTAVLSSPERSRLMCLSNKVLYASGILLVQLMEILYIKMVIFLKIKIETKLNIIM